MNCPDCGVQMEAQDNSSEKLPAGFVKSGEKVPLIVSTEYFCPNDKSSWLWVKGEKGLIRQGTYR